MTKLPKKTKPQWGALATLCGGIFFLFIIFVLLLGSIQGGYHFGGWLFNFFLVWIGHIIVKKYASREIRAKVKFKKGDADIFANTWYDLLCIIVLGIIINISNSIFSQPINVIMEIALFIPYYFIYKKIFELPELELYAKYNKIKKRKGKDGKEKKV